MMKHHRKHDSIYIAQIVPMSNFCHLLKNVKETDWAKKVQ